MADFLAVIVLAVSVLMIFAMYRVISKMGFPGWYIALLLVPVVGQFFFLYLAFAEWPIEKDMAGYRFQIKMAERLAHSNPETPPLPGQGVDPREHVPDAHHLRPEHPVQRDTTPAK